MRTLVALTALLSAFHTTSDACGWMPPQVELHRVAAHATHGFVVLGAAPKVDDGRWLRLSPETYDYSQVAELAWLPRSRDLTLIGDGGTRIVAADHQVALREWGERERAVTALEVPSGFELALDGAVRDAKWHRVQLSYVAPPKVVDLDLEVRFENASFTVLSKGKAVTSGQGRIRGVLDANGERFLVVDTKAGELQTVYFGRAA